MTPDNGMQRTALGAAVDAERSTEGSSVETDPVISLPQPREYE